VCRIEKNWIFFGMGFATADLTDCAKGIPNSLPFWQLRAAIRGRSAAALPFWQSLLWVKNRIIQRGEHNSGHNVSENETAKVDSHLSPLRYAGKSSNDFVSLALQAPMISIIPMLPILFASIFGVVCFDNSLGKNNL
jgi:hypothetical protein